MCHTNDRRSCNLLKKAVSAEKCQSRGGLPERSCKDASQLQPGYGGDAVFTDGPRSFSSACTVRGLPTCIDTAATEAVYCVRPPEPQSLGETGTPVARMMANGRHDGKRWA